MLFLSIFLDFNISFNKYQTSFSYTISTYFECCYNRYIHFINIVLKQKKVYLDNRLNECFKMRIGCKKSVIRKCFIVKIFEHRKILSDLKI